MLPPNQDAAGFNFVPTIRHDTYPSISPTKTNLQNRSVFITGASKGVGRSTALSFAKAGVSKIAIGARSSLTSVEADLHDAATSTGHPIPQILALQLDISDPESITRAAEQTSLAFDGKLDILINNAAAMEDFAPTLDVDPEQWWTTWTTNVRGTFLLSRALLPLLLASHSKQIIIVSSIGSLMPGPGGSGYQISKLALLRYTEYLNLEYSAQGLIAYALHPGSMPTDLGLSLPEFLHTRLIDKPQLGADVMVFLTRERREWLRGRYVSVNWDMEEFLGKREEVERGDKLKVKLSI